MISPTHFTLAAFERQWPEWREHPHYAALLSRVEAVDARCWLCGHAHAKMLPRRQQVNEGFTNHGWAQEPRSEWLCLPCAVTLMSHPNNRHYWRLNGHLVTVEGISHPARMEWRDVLLDPPEPPFLVAIPTSRQKHLLFRCRVALGRDVFPVQLEEESVLWDDRARAGLDQVERALAAGLTRYEIGSGVSSRRALNGGMDGWFDLEIQLRPLRRTRLMELLLHIANKPTSEVGRCSDSQPTMAQPPPRHSSSTRLGAAATPTG